MLNTIHIPINFNFKFNLPPENANYREEQFIITGSDLGNLLEVGLDTFLKLYVLDNVGSECWFYTFLICGFENMYRFF